MRDAEFEWSSQVSNSVQIAESLESEVDSLVHDLHDLIHRISDLHTVSFDDDISDYEIRRAAQQLWDVVFRGVGEIQQNLNATRRSITDTGMSADYYRRRV